MEDGFALSRSRPPALPGFVAVPLSRSFGLSGRKLKSTPYPSPLPRPCAGRTGERRLGLRDHAAHDLRYRQHILDAANALAGSEQYLVSTPGAGGCRHLSSEALALGARLIALGL